MGIIAVWYKKKGVANTQVNVHNLEQFTSSLIYNACQMGVKVDLNDLSPHTFIDLHEYATKLLNNEQPAVDFATLRKSRG